MYRVATNVITDHFRQLSSEHKKLTEAAHEPRTEESVVFAHEPDEIELTQCVRPFISCLPEAYEQALSLTEIDGLTQAQAAEKLGISLSGLKSRVQRGREKLKKEFVNCCRIELDRRGRVIDVESKTPVCGC